MSDSLSAWAALARDLLALTPDFSSSSLGQPRVLDEDILQLRRRRIDSLFYLVGDPNCARQRLYNRLWNLQSRVLKEITSSFERCGIPHLVFKGSEFIARYFENRSIGMLYDVDILIPRNHVGEAKRTLYSVGLRQAVFDTQLNRLVDRDVGEIARLEGNHYELAPFAWLETLSLDDDEFREAQSYNEFPIWCHEGKAFFVVEVDVHHGVAMDLTGEEFFGRAVRSAFASSYTLSPADHLWFTLSRFYVEVGLHNKRSLRDLAYVQAMLKMDRIDWDVVISAANDYQIKPAIFYFLTFLSSLSPDLIDSQILKLVRPLNEPGIRDYGPMLHTLFDFTPSALLPG